MAKVPLCPTCRTPAVPHPCRVDDKGKRKPCAAGWWMCRPCGVIIDTVRKRISKGGRITWPA